MNKISLSSIFMTFVLLITFVHNLSAHPHEYANVKLILHMDDSTLSRISSTWIFDEMTSELIKTDFDTNMDGTFDLSEIKRVKEDGFDCLKEVDYYAFLQINSNKIDITEKMIRNFTAFIEDEKVVYSFDLYTDLAFRHSDKIKFTYSDNEFYTAFLMKSNDVTITGEHVQTTFTVNEEETELYYSDVLNITVIE